ncbi:hypothetical protein Csa_008254, partial [Cucumis sativus]
MFLMTVSIVIVNFMESSDVETLPLPTPSQSFCVYFPFSSSIFLFTPSFLRSFSYLRPADPHTVTLLR